MEIAAPANRHFPPLALTTLPTPAPGSPAPAPGSGTPSGGGGGGGGVTSGGGTSGGGGGDDAISAYDLIRAIDKQHLKPSDLPASDRQRCVAYLSDEGFTSAQIANVLRISERTVRRDRTALRKENALTPDLTLGDELLGELQAHTQTAIAQLTRLANDPETPPHIRVRAHDAITRAQQRLIDTANRLHYLESGQLRLKRLRDNDPNKPNPFEGAHTLMRLHREAMDKARKGLL